MSETGLRERGNLARDRILAWLSLLLIAHDDCAAGWRERHRRGQSGSTKRSRRRDATRPTTYARVNRLVPLDLRDQVLEALRRLGGEAQRAEIIREALVVGGWTAEERAVRSPVQPAARRFHLPTMADHVITTLAEHGEIDSPSYGRWRLAGNQSPDDVVRFGVRYRQAARDDVESRGVVDPRRDLDSLERRTARQMELQDRFTDSSEAIGLLVRSPKEAEPQYDLAFEAGPTVWVAEIKTLADAYQTQKMRLGLGQVVEYRHSLSQRLGTEVAALAASRSTARGPGDTRDPGVRRRRPSR